MPNLQDIIPAFFTGPGGARLTPEQIAQRQQVAQSLLAKATDTSPNAGGWASVISKGIMGLSSGFQEGRAERAATANAEANQSLGAKLLSGLSGGLSGGMTASPSVAAPANVSPVAELLTQSVPTAPSESLAQSAPASATAGTDWLKYSNQNATRSLPLSEKLVNSLSFLPELGVQMEVFSGGQPAKGTSNKRVGSIRHDHGESADVFFSKDGRRLDWANPQDVPLFQDIVRKAKEKGVTGFGAGPGYMQPGSMHIGFGAPSVWGAGGKGENAPKWLREAFNGSGAAPMPEMAQASIRAPAPVEVASLDPSIGMASAYAPQQQAQPSASMQAINAAMTPQAAPMAPQMAAPAPASRASGMDVWQGRANQGTATDGTQLTRLPDGSIQRTNRFGVTERMSPEGEFLGMVNGGMGGGQAAPQSPLQPQSTQAAPMNASQNAGMTPSMEVAQAIAPAQSSPGAGLDPALVQALTDPTVSPQNRQIASMLLERQMSQQQAAQETAKTQAARQQELQQRQAIAQQYGIDPSLVPIDDAWKLSLERAIQPKDRATATVNGVVIDTNTGQPIFEAPQPDPTSIQEYNFYAEQAKAAGQQPMPYNDWSLQNTKAGATQFNMGGGSDKQVFDVMNEGAVSARAAASGLRALKEARAAIQQGGIFGAGADMRLGLAKLGTYFGLDPSQVVNTETFRSAIAPQVAAVMKATVGSSQISNTDREFAEKAAGGNINLDQNSITRLLDIMERGSNDIISTHQSRLNAVYPDQPEYRRERALFGVQMPEFQPTSMAPQGQAQQSDVPSPAPQSQGGFTVIDGVKIRPKGGS